MAELQAALQKRRKMEEGAIWASEIAPHLFLGRGQDAKNLQQLQSHGVTHILNVADDVDNFHPSLFTYANLNVTDFGGDKGIGRVFPLARDFVKSALDGEGNNILVHCANGSNRSATVVIALLMMLPLVGPDVGSSEMESGRSVSPGTGTGQTSSGIASELTPGAGSGSLDYFTQKTESEAFSSTKIDPLLKMDPSGSEMTTKRSSSVMETGTMSSEKTLGMSLKDAYQHVKMRHSATAPLRDNRAQLVMFEKELRGLCSMTEEDFK